MSKNELYKVLVKEMQFAVKMGDISEKDHMKAFYHGKEHGIEVAMKLLRTNKISN